MQLDEAFRDISALLIDFNNLTERISLEFDVGDKVDR